MSEHTITMTKTELRELMSEVVTETLTKIGIDTEHPLEAQRDSQFVRDWREASESVKGKALVVAVGVLVVGALGALWLGIKTFLLKG